MRPHAIAKKIANNDSSTVTIRPLPNSGRLRRMKFRSSDIGCRQPGASERWLGAPLVSTRLHIKALRRRVLLEPFLPEGRVVVVARTPAPLLHHGVEIAPPDEIARFHKNRIVLHGAEQFRQFVKTGIV